MSSFVEFGIRLDPVPADVVSHLGRIDHAAGRAALYGRQLPRLLTVLRDRAQVESVESSSAIEGVVAPQARAAAVIRDPNEQIRNRSEAELRGYSNALTYIFKKVPAQELSVGLILHLHRLLYEPSGAAGAGQFKTSDNVVVDRNSAGQRRIRFTPVAAAWTPAALKRLIDDYRALRARSTHHHLLAIAGFVLDFTVIHPFAGGNGRVSRLLLNLLLDANGYDAIRYVSIEGAIERSKERYYDTLLASTGGWHEAAHDIWPWARYFTEVLEGIYGQLERYAEAERSHGSKQARVRRHLENHAGTPLSMADLRTALPGVSDATIRTVLHRLRDEGLATTTTGRGARWVASDGAQGED